MRETHYGKNKVLYEVVETANGRIQLNVRHSNSAMRHVLKNAIGNPRRLLACYDAFSRSSIRAKYWLAHVMNDYRVYFEKEQVDIVLK